MLNDSTRKTVFNAKWLFGSFKLICFDVDEKSLGDDILRLNNFGLMYELWKEIATARGKDASTSQTDRRTDNLAWQYSATLCFMWYKQYTVPKKEATKLWAVTLSNLN